MNIVEMISDEQHDAPCRHGNIVDGHACYCHSTGRDAPRKCPIWSRYGEHDLERWRKDKTWENGCPFFEANDQGEAQPPAKKL
jgi:hypothetical protein